MNFAGLVYVYFRHLTAKFQPVGVGSAELRIFTTLLLGPSRSGAPFRDIFSILVALFLGAVL